MSVVLVLVALPTPGDAGHSGESAIFWIEKKVFDVTNLDESLGIGGSYFAWFTSSATSYVRLQPILANRLQLWPRTSEAWPTHSMTPQKVPKE